MKVIGHLVVQKGYGLVITASQWASELSKQCEEYNEEYCGEGHRLLEKKRTIVTVEFEVPDDLFKPDSISKLEAKVIPQE